MDKEKQVIMSYAEHQGWLAMEESHKREIEKMGEYIAEQEEIMNKLIDERDDIVVIEMKRMMVQKNWKIKGSTFRLGRAEYEDRYVNWPRFIGGDELAESLDQGFMEMRQEILDLKESANKARDSYMFHVHQLEESIAKLMRLIRKHCNRRQLKKILGCSK